MCRGATVNNTCLPQHVVVVVVAVVVVVVDIAYLVLQHDHKVNVELGLAQRDIGNESAKNRVRKHHRLLRALLPQVGSANGKSC